VSVFASARNLSKSYGEGAASVTALDDVCLELRAGELVTVFGPSGCGKSTLLHLLGGLDRPSAGTIHVGDDDLTAMDEESLARFRRDKLGFVFQFHHLLPIFTAVENAALPLLLSNVPRRRALRRATECLEMVGLGDKLERKPGELSGGQQQRVAVARALANDPILILADEPTGNLDSASAHAVFELLRGVAREEHRSVLVVSHNPEAAEYSSRIVHMVDGRIVKDPGQASEVH